MTNTVMEFKKCVSGLANQNIDEKQHFSCRLLSLVSPSRECFSKALSEHKALFHLGLSDLLLKIICFLKPKKVAMLATSLPEPVYHKSWEPLIPILTVSEPGQAQATTKSRLSESLARKAAKSCDSRPESENVSKEGPAEPQRFFNGIKVLI